MIATTSSVNQNGVSNAKGAIRHPVVVPATLRRRPARHLVPGRCAVHDDRHLSTGGWPWKSEAPSPRSRGSRQKRSTGLADAAFKAGFTHYDAGSARHPRARRGRRRWRSCAIGDRFRFANHLAAVRRLRRRRALRACRATPAVAPSGPRPCGSASASRSPPSACPTARPSRRSATAGCGSRRPRVAAPAAGAPSRCAGRRSCSSVRRSRGPRSSSTLHADGRAEGRLVGASPFPRHWIYDATGHARGQDRHDRLQGLGRPTPSATTRPGVTRTHRRSSPRSRPRSSGSSPT